MKLPNNAVTVIAIGVTGVVVAYIIANRATAAAEAVGQAVNPTNPDNIFHSAVNGVGRYVSGDPYWTLGGQVYDWLNDDEVGGNLANPYLPR